MRKFGIAALLLAISTAAWGQFGNARPPTANSFGVGDVIMTDKGPRPVKIGDVIIVNGQEIAIGPNTVLHINPSFDKVSFKDTGAVVKLPSVPVDIGFYPFAVFSYSGALGNQGGTLSFNGEVFTLNAALLAGKRQSVELGGFYFAERGGRDIYQANLRFHMTPEWGTQIAYLNTRNGHAPAITNFLLYNLSSARVASNAKRAWGLEIGIGTYWNVGKDLTAQNGAGGNVNFNEVPRSTVNFTYYLNASIAITKTVNLSASQWYIRDRNGELNRFTIGLGFRF